MLGAYTMEKLGEDCGGDFKCFVSNILARHLKAEPADWLKAALDQKPDGTAIKSNGAL